MPYYGSYPMGLYQPIQNQYQPMNQPMNQPVQQQNQSPTVPQTNAQPNFFCRPVASKEEALGVPVDFMGQPMFFPDLAHNVVYMKRFNTNTGAADLFEFHGQQIKEQNAPAEAFAPLEDFMDLKDALDQLRVEVDKLKKPANRTVKKNDDE